MDLLFTWFVTLPAETKLFVAVLSALTFYFHLHFNQKSANIGPMLLTTGGIFCTFFGIALGLSHFNIADIAQSIPELLAGLKTAFWASVIGVGGALSLKLRDYTLGVEDNPYAPRDATINDLNKNLASLVSGLSSSDGQSLVSQIKLMRQDINDGFKNLQASQEKSLEALAQMGSKALIEALEDVIRDFNNKLTSQFGENFKQLNQAVHKLVEWQEGYKTHVEASESAITNAVKALQYNLQVIDVIAQKSAIFVEAASNLSSLLGEINKNVPLLSENTNTLNEFLKNASATLPTLKLQTENLIEITLTGISEANKRLTATAETATKEIQSANSEMTKATTELANQIRAQSTALEKEIEKALTVSITTLGQQLSTLSQQFATDYQPITQSVRELLQAVRRGTSQ